MESGVPNVSSSLGELEMAVMEYVWATRSCDVKTVHRAVGAPRQITSNTVQSTLERLYRKGMLAREKVSHAYVYSAVRSREQVTATVVSDVVERLVQGKTDAMLAAFVDVAARAGDSTLARLEKLISKRRSQDSKRKK